MPASLELAVNAETSQCGCQKIRNAYAVAAYSQGEGLSASHPPLRGHPLQGET